MTLKYRIVLRNLKYYLTYFLIKPLRIGLSFITRNIYKFEITFLDKKTVEL